MPSDTISVMTFADSEPISAPDTSEGQKGVTSTVPGWGHLTRTGGDLLPETSGTKYLVRRDVPMETIEREFQKLISLMDRIFSQTEQSPEAPNAVPTSASRMLRLNEVSLTVEINAEGGLSILGTGGKLGGKGGMTLKFT